MNQLKVVASGAWNGIRGTLRELAKFFYNKLLVHLFEYLSFEKHIN